MKISTKLSRAFRKAADAANDLQRDIEAIRDRLADLRDRRRNVEDAPLPRKEAEAQLRQKIVGLGKGFSPWPGNVARGGRLPSLEFAEAFKADPLAALCSVAPEGVFQAYAWALPPGGEGLSETDRAAAMATIDAEIADLELVEEASIRAAERAGVAALRRGDADPTIVLLPDTALPL